MKIVFLGSGAFGIPSLEAMVRAGHELALVVTQPDRPAGRGKQLMETPVGAWAGARKLEVIKTADVNGAEILARIRDAAPECLVVIAFGQKLSDELLGIAPRGAINLHSSLLPKYRGAAPINWAILNRDREAGVSVIEVTRVMDAGDILAQATLTIGQDQTAGELHDRLAELGAPLLPRVLEAMASGNVERRAQDPALATRAPKLSREMAWVDFAAGAEEVSARIRGMSPWPGVQVALTDAAGKPRTVATLLKCRAVALTARHAAEQCGSVLGDRTVACGSGAIELIAIQPAGKKAMDMRAFANGYGFAEGARLRSTLEPRR